MTDRKPRPYVLLSCAMSADGHIDDTSSRRLLLSNDADFDRVDGERAQADAILVGANTIRRDNPRLLVRSADRREDRISRGLPASPTKVTLTATGDLDPEASFFSRGEDIPKLVYCTTPALARTATRLSAAAPLTNVVDAGDPLDLVTVVGDLAERGVRRLMVEGGQSIHTQFLASGLADEVQLVVAPFFVGNRAAPGFVGDGAVPWDSNHRMTLAEVRPIGDVVLLRYLLPRAALGRTAAEAA